MWMIAFLLGFLNMPGAFFADGQDASMYAKRTLIFFVVGIVAIFIHAFMTPEGNDDL